MRGSSIASLVPWVLIACGGDGAQPGADAPTASIDADSTQGIDANTATAPIAVAVLGSSTAAGKNLDEPIYGGAPGGLAFSWVNRYIGYLAARPGSQVTNVSKPGAGTYSALPAGTVNPPNRPAVDPEFNITVALAANPDAVIVSFPSGGDLGNGYTVDEIMTNLAVIAAAATAEDVEVWVTTPNPVLDATTNQQALILQLRAEIQSTYGTHAIDFYGPRALPDGDPDPALTLLDDVHPNAEGHRLLFEQVVAADLPGALLAP
jgi:hypothetical protein